MLRVSIRSCRRWVLPGSLPAAIVCACVTLYAEHEITLDKHDMAVIDSRVHEDFEAAGILFNDAPLTTYFDGIITDLRSGETTVSGNRFTVKIISSSDLNAFSLSDGTIYISLSMLGLIDNKAQLAFLLAHEMAHIELDHHIEIRYEIQEQALKAAQNQIAGSIFGISIPASHYTRMALSGFSRKNEAEADSTALLVLHRRGYNVAQAAKLFSIMYKWLKYKERKVYEQYATHPKLLLRYKACKKQISGLGADSTMAADDGYRTAVTPYLPTIARLLLMSNSVHELYTMVLDKINLLGDSHNWEYLKGKLLELYWATDSFPAATEALKATANGDGTDGRQAMRDMGWLLLKNGQSDSAAMYLQEYLRQTPGASDSSLVNYYLGIRP